MKFKLLFWIRGNGRAGSRPSGLSTGSTSAAKVMLDPGARRRIPVLGIEYIDTGVTQSGQQHIVETGVLIAHQVLGARVNGGQLLGQAKPVGTDGGRAELEQLLEAGDADLEELVQVAG